MSTDTKSSVQMDNVVPPNTNNEVTTNYHPLPPVSEKTQRELQASTEKFMRTYRQQHNVTQHQGNAGSQSGSSRSSSAPAHTNANSYQSTHKDKDVNMKPPEKNVQPDDGKKEDKKSS